MTSAAHITGVPARPALVRASLPGAPSLGASRGALPGSSRLSADEREKERAAAARAAAAGTPAAAPADGPTLLSRAGSSLLTVRYGLKLLDTSRGDAPLSAFLLARGVDRWARLAGHKLLPDVANHELVGRTLSAWIVSMNVKSALEGIPEALDQVRDTLRASRAQGASTGVGAVANALVQPAPSAVAEAAAGAAKLDPWRAGSSVGEKAASLLDPTYRAAFAIFSVADLWRFASYVGEHGTDGLISTREGRAALIDAIGGATALPPLALPATPLTAILDGVSSLSMLVSSVNSLGWLDGLLGGEREDDARDGGDPPGS